MDLFAIVLFAQRQSVMEGALRGALIGGAIGAVIGIGIWAVRKLSGGNDKKKDDPDGPTDA